jgi:hypothetical protein
VHFDADDTDAHFHPHADGNRDANLDSDAHADTHEDAGHRDDLAALLEARAADRGISRGGSLTSRRMPVISLIPAAA